MQIYLTIPGIKKQSIIIPDTATLADFAREAFDKTGARIFQGFGLSNKVGAQPNAVLPVEAALTNLTLVKPAGTVVAFSTATPATGTLTVGGAFAAGVVLTATIGGVVVSYTTKAGDTNVNGVATSLAAAIVAANVGVTAVAAGAVITLTSSGGFNLGLSSTGTGVTLTSSGAALTGGVRNDYSALITNFGIADGDEVQCWNNPLGTSTTQGLY